MPTLHGAAMSEPTVETCDLCARPGNTLVTCDECQDDVRASALEEAAQLAETTDIHKFYDAIKAIIARRIRSLKSAEPVQPEATTAAPVDAGATRDLALVKRALEAAVHARCSLCREGRPLIDGGTGHPYDGNDYNFLACYAAPIRAIDPATLLKTLEGP